MVKGYAMLAEFIQLQAWRRDKADKKQTSIFNISTLNQHGSSSG